MKAEKMHKTIIKECGEQEININGSERTEIEAVQMAEKQVGESESYQKLTGEQGEYLVRQDKMTGLQVIVEFKSEPDYEAIESDIISILKSEYINRMKSEACQAVDMALQSTTQNEKGDR